MNEEELTPNQKSMTSARLLAVFISLSVCIFAGCSCLNRTDNSVEVCPNYGFDNKRFCTAIYIPTGRAPSAWIDLPFRWPTNETTLRVSFLGGSKRLQTEVIRVARQWERECGIVFDFGSHTRSDLRVAFQCLGHWSYVGVQNRLIPQNKATMNLQLTESSTEEEIRRVVLHEFGHAIGLQHEHQHPEGGIQWNVPKVIDYYTRTQGWTEDEVRFQVLNRSRSSNYETSGFDTASIMMYPIPAYLTLDGLQTGWNVSLSVKDKELVRKVYGAPR